MYNTGVGFSAVSSVRCGHHERHSLCGPRGHPVPAQEGQGQTSNIHAVLMIQQNPSFKGAV